MKLDTIRIIDKSELEGTCYMEILPGEYHGQCWNEGSLYFTEEGFSYFEEIIKNIVPEYDHYEFIGILSGKWRAIANDFSKMEDLLSSAKSIDELKGKLGYFFEISQEDFNENFEKNRRDLVCTTHKFIVWIRAKLEEYDTISILGI
jgi:hypothetical protein